ncbi:hypothetical protein F5X68DRAFT_5546 [Plectosphaerella plurivora]|uniref:Uncharacterized protein n=1 Tax=Plectosphaerella plurivora TaxID=936078 RepID=A0A9P9AGS3_9PEZI|nr:hypothetical protein F5X68DRAFT_5546 [Plectosphaerella plurivora]
MAPPLWKLKQYSLTSEGLKDPQGIQKLLPLALSLFPSYSPDDVNHLQQLHLRLTSRLSHKMSCPNTKAHDGGYFSPGTWGFIVYRLTYKDQEFWDDYLEYIHKAVRAMIDRQVSEELWEPPEIPAPPNPREAEIRAEAEEEKNNFHLCLREGPELDGRSIEDVRAINSNWLPGLRPVLPPELSWQCNWAARTVDLTFVMCVDDDSLDRFRKLRAAKTAGVEADFRPATTTMSPSRWYGQATVFTRRKTIQLMKNLTSMATTTVPRLGSISTSIAYRASPMLSLEATEYGGIVLYSPPG